MDLVDELLKTGGYQIKINRKRTSALNMMAAADIVIALTRDLNSKDHKKYVHVIKNRHDGNCGKADPEKTINVCCRMIADSIFGDKLKLFRVELEKEIKKTIMKKIGDAHDPFRRTGSGDGSQ